MIEIKYTDMKNIIVINLYFNIRMDKNKQNISIN